MKEIKTKPSEWKQVIGGYETPEGIKLSTVNISATLRYAGIPETLMNVDDKYKTNTVQEVLVKQVESVSLRETPKGTFVVMDPRSKFIEDDIFLSYADKIEKETGVKPLDMSNDFLHMRLKYTVDAKQGFLSDGVS